MTLQMRCKTPSFRAGNSHDATAVRRSGLSSAERRLDHSRIHRPGWLPCLVGRFRHQRPPTVSGLALLHLRCLTRGQAARISLRSGQNRSLRFPGLRRPWPAHWPCRQFAPPKSRCFGPATGHFDFVNVLHEVIRIGQPDPVTGAMLLLASCPSAGLLPVSEWGIAVTVRPDWLRMQQAFF